MGQHDCGAHSDHKHVGWYSSTALMLLMALALGGCSVFASSALPNGSSATSGDIPSHSASAPYSSTVAVNVPTFTSAVALTAMQRWAAEVKSGRIVDGSAVRSPSNSGWIGDASDIRHHVPYGVSSAYATGADGPNRDGPIRQVISVVGSVLYVFAYHDAASTSAPSQVSYGLLLGTINGAGQPITLLVWISSDTPLLTGLPLVKWSPALPIDAVTYNLGSDVEVASVVASRFFFGRTMTVRFVTAFDSSVSGPPQAAEDEPQTIKRNNAALALVTKPTTQQTNTGVFTTLPSPGFAITLQEGLDAPDCIRLPSEPQHHTFGILTS